MLYGGAATVGTLVYAIGSGVVTPPLTTTNNYNGVNEAYQAFTDSWTTRTSMPCCGSLAWSSARLVAAQGNRVFTFATNPPPLPAGAKAWEVNKYDATSDLWTSCAHALHRPVCSSGVGGARFVIVCR